MSASASAQIPIFGKLLVMKIIFTLFFFCIHSTSWSQNPLFFSEYVEGSANNKALEIYNNSPDAIDLASEGYTVQFYLNGNTSPITLSLKGTLLGYDVYVLSHRQFALTVSSNAIDLRDSTITNWFNGDDAIVLRKGGANGPMVDVFGQIGYDPGTQWSANGVNTMDRTLIRKQKSSEGTASLLIRLTLLNNGSLFPRMW